MTGLTLEQQQNAASLAAKEMTQEKAQAYEMVGMLKAFDFTKKLVTVTNLKILAEIKESKIYKGMQLVNHNGEMVTVTTFRGFCDAVGLSGETVD